jgi:biotin synthase-related radical SAM superfamily protein
MGDFMIIEKEVTLTEIVKIKVDVQDLIDSLTSQEAMETVLLIDKAMESWPFTIELVTNLLDVMNKYNYEIYNEETTQEFVKQLKLAVENFL